MKRMAGILFLSLSVFLVLGWMLATPNPEINSAVGMPILADGGAPVPPPPNDLAGGFLLADGGAPVPPPPNAQSDGALLADGGAPVPPPPNNLFVGGSQQTPAPHAA